MQKFPTIVAFDLETTGLDSQTDKIIEIGILKFTLNQRGDLIKLDSFEQLIDPEVELTLSSELITGINKEDLKGQPTIEQLVPVIIKKFGGADFILGHNIGFDVAFLEKYLPLKFKKLDSQFFAETFFPGLPSYSLDVLPFELNIAREIGHRALPDTINSAELFCLCLRQFAALKNNKEILEFAKKGELHEAEILEAMLNLKVTNKLFTPATKLKSETAIIPEIKKAAAEKFKNKKQNLILHSARPGGPASAVDALNLKHGKTIIAVKHPEEINANLISISNISKLICQERLEDLLNKKTLRPAEAGLAMKLMVSESGKLSREERHYLPEVLMFPEICQEHECENFKKLDILNKKDFAVAFSHYDFWSLDLSPQGGNLPKGTKLLLTDFDEAVDSLMKKLEIKLSTDFLPAILKCISTDDEKIKKLISAVINKNDLFWGILNISFKKTEEASILLTPELRDDYEFGKWLGASESLTKALSDLIGELQTHKDNFLRAFGFYLTRTLNSWHALSDSENYHVYFERGYEGINLKLAASFELIKKEFEKRIPETALLTAATGADSIGLHYINMLGLENWPRTVINLPSVKHSSLFIATNNAPSIEKALRVILTEAPAKAVVVAKNARDVAVFYEHLKNSLPMPIFSAEGGSSSKALYKFAREERAVLIISPRGRILDLVWPQIDLCVVSSIPFPLPEAHFTFVSGSLPKAMLAQKLLISKILKSGAPELKIYLTDTRLTGQNYGENFISLTSQLLGCEPEFLKL